MSTRSRPALRRVACLALLAILAAVFTTLADTGDPPGLDLAPYRGKVVLVDFWASWCGPCAASFPWMESMRERYAAQGFEIVSINLDSDRDSADRFLANGYGAFHHVFDPEGARRRNSESRRCPPR
ncbi:MAG: TlpA family protein disulfide reductase [Acidobacteria bacterium]|nr:TlpA family protein disulfide reductase [Acidobacteriota bacterium]